MDGESRVAKRIGPMIRRGETSPQVNLLSEDLISVPFTTTEEKLIPDRPVITRETICTQFLALMVALATTSNHRMSIMVLSPASHFGYGAHLPKVLSAAFPNAQKLLCMSQRAEGSPMLCETTFVTVTCALNLGPNCWITKVQ